MQRSPLAETANVRYGRYEVLFRIAAGGMAEVYAAKIVGEGGFEKMVALKRMLPTLAEDEKFVAMFLDEGRVAANISSPYVVQTLDLGRADDDSLYLVMELVVGVSLSAMLRLTGRAQRMIPLPIAAEIIAQAAQGLHDAHEARTVYGEPLSIVHRDVSPQNILIDISGRARITDFGVARALQRMTHTQNGEVKGKLAYFAPEQARAKEIDRRSDVFALGIVAWETLGGRRLFAGSNPAEVLTKVLEMPVPRLDELRPEVPLALADAIARALERDPARRWSSAAEFAHAIRAACACATGAEIAAFVRENGGESLMKLEDGLRSQTPSSPSMRGATSLPPPEGSGVMRAGPHDDDAPTTLTPSLSMKVAPEGGFAPPPAGAATPPPGALAQHRESLTAERVASAAPASRGVPPVVVVVLLVAVVTAAGAAAWLAGRTSGDSSVAVELPVASEPVAVPPLAVPTLAEPTPPEPTLAEPALPEPALPERVVTAVEAEPAAPEGEASPAAASSATPSRRRPVRATSTAARTPEPVARPVERPTTPTRTAEPARARDPQPATTPQRPGALRGLDDFERELGQ